MVWYKCLHVPGAVFIGPLMVILETAHGTRDGAYGMLPKLLMQGICRQSI
jgi:hypothetical protein